MSVETLLLIFLVIIILGVLPTWPHSSSWGYAPTGVLTVLLVVFLIWAIAGERPLFRSAGGDIRAAGRDVAASVRDAVR